LGSHHNYLDKHSSACIRSPVPWPRVSLAFKLGNEFSSPHIPPLPPSLLLLRPSELRTQRRPERATSQCPGSRVSVQHFPEWSAFCYCIWPPLTSKFTHKNCLTCTFPCIRACQRYRAYPDRRISLIFCNSTVPNCVPSTLRCPSFPCSCIRRHGGCNPWQTCLHAASAMQACFPRMLPCI